MSPEDARLVAALTLLRDDLTTVVDQVTAGELGQTDRDQLARVLRLVADDLAPPVVVSAGNGEERPVLPSREDGALEG